MSGTISDELHPLRTSREARGRLYKEALRLALVLHPAFTTNTTTIKPSSTLPVLPTICPKTMYFSLAFFVGFVMLLQTMNVSGLNKTSVVPEDCGTDSGNSCSRDQ
jgi:hypothetical protein